MNSNNHSDFCSSKLWSRIYRRIWACCFAHSDPNKLGKDSKLTFSYPYRSRYFIGFSPGFFIECSFILDIFWTNFEQTLTADLNTHYPNPTFEMHLILRVETPTIFDRCMILITSRSSILNFKDCPDTV